MILQEKDCISKKQSKRQKRMAANKEKQCPLCLEPLELDDLNFYPCKCGYQVCRFCWHRIRTNENGLCPACRRQYPEDPVTFKPLSTEEIMKQKNEKKMKEIQKKKEIAESRKQLANIRVVQKNLVYVHGLPLGVDTDEDKFRKLNNIFKEFGPVTKCVINNRTNYAGSQTPRASAYVTYQKIEDALKAYKKLPSLKIENHEIKTSLGTTKYCSNFLKNVQCPKQDCMYLHEMADEELSFTKEQIHAGQHLNCGSMLYDRMMAQATQKIAQNSQPKEAPSEKPETTNEVEKTIPEEVKLKGDSSDSSDDSSPSPVQSRLHRLYTNSDVQNSICGSDFQSRLGCQLNSLSSENSRNIVTTSELPVQQSLSSEEIPVNMPHAPVNSIHNDTKQFQNFPTNVRDMFNGNMWPEPKNTAQPNLHNNFHQNSLSSDYILNSGNSSSSIFSRLPFANNGTSNSLEKEDDDLGFDPCQLSLDALQTIVDNEAKSNPRANVPSSKGMFVQKPTPVLNQQHLRMRPTQQHMLQQQRLRNPPPPGFAANNFTSTQQQLPSPVYESRNAVPSRMSPVINMPNSYNPSLRANFPMQRFQSTGMPMSNNSIVNGYAHQAPAIRTLAPQMHDLMPRSTPNTQHMQSQRLENIPMQQYQEQNLSPSFWNVNQQTQWMTPENFQNQSMPEYRPASPLLTIRPQQMRTNDYQRTLQQITTRYNNLSPFTDNSQPLSANQILHNQLTKGVHTFP